MTYHPNRIEIESDGTVTRGGKHLGTLTFASISARMDAVGEHFAEDGEGDYEMAAELRRAEDALEDAEYYVSVLCAKLDRALGKARSGAGIPEIIEILEAAE